MACSLGKAIPFLAIVSLLSGVWLAVEPARPRRDLTLWVFATPHFHEYQDSLRPAFEQQSGKSLEVDLIPLRALDMRLAALFMSQQESKELPDAVEVEIGSFGRYLRPPADEVQFLPLNAFLEKSGWNHRLLPARLLASTKEGKIFALPHDVHPVALAFREDLFREAGVSLIDEAGHSTVPTWPEFQKKCVRFQDYWRSRGYPIRHAIELPQSNSGMLSIMLLQRHINLIDRDLKIHIDDPIVAQTLAFYAQLVAGPDKISGETEADSGLEYKDLADGNLCALLTPDWKIELIRQYVPVLAGKLRIIPLPRFDADDAPTASYGGTLIGIPRACKHPEEAWKLIEFLYLSPEALRERQKSGILPPIPQAWNDPGYHQSDPFFGGQRAMETYTELARQVPPAYMTPLTPLALGTLSYVQSNAVAYVRAHGAEGLEHQCQLWLNAAAVDLERRIEHSRFEP